MGISLAELPERYRKQATEKYRMEEEQKKTKYGNRKTEVNGIVFDSRKEAGRYQELLLLLKAGEIKDLKLQETFVLQNGYVTPEGRRIKAITYRADFTYLDGEGRKIVEDVKSAGTRTREYILKRKLMQDRHHVTIQEV